MSDLINGREMLNRYQADLCYGIACKECSMSTEEGGCRVEKWIDTFPSADRPQGEWKSVKASIYPYGYDVECSVCGHRMGSSFGYKYCPMCGAHMKGADDESVDSN